MMLYEGEHVLMTVRYLIWASRTTGQLSTFAWLLAHTTDSGDYQVVEPALQKLPDNMREDRVLRICRELSYRIVVGRIGNPSYVHFGKLLFYNA